METRSLPSLGIQHDWYTALKEGDKKIWTTLKQPGQNSVHGYVYPQQQNEYSGRDESQFEMWQNETVVKAVHTPSMTETIFLSPSQSFKLHNRRLNDLDISPAGDLGLSCSEDGLAWIWDSRTGKIRVRQRTFDVLLLDLFFVVSYFSRTRNSNYVQMYGRTYTQWSLIVINLSGQDITLHYTRSLDGHYGDVNTCRVFPSGVVVLTGGADFRLKIWSARDGSSPRTFTGHTRGITDTAMIDRGRNFVSVSRDGTARLWECGTGQCLRTLAKGNTPMTSCCCMSGSSVSSASGDKDGEFGVAGKVLAVTDDGGGLTAVDLRSGEQVFVKEFDSGLTKCVSMDDTGLAVGTEKGEVVEVDIRNVKQPIRTVMTSSEVTSLTLADNRKFVMSTANGSCFVWDSGVPDDHSLVKLTGPDGDRLTSVAVHRDSVWTAGRDGTVRMYSDVFRLLSEAHQDTDRSFVRV